MKSTNTRPSRAKLLFVVVGLLVLQSQVFAQDKTAKMDEVMRLSHSYGQFNGAVLVAESGKVIYRKGFGLANMEWNISNEPDTRFRLGSITKQFTAMLILQLAEQGKIKLDGKLSDYLPDYRKDTGGRITIHQLLNHTSGIPSYTSLPGFIADQSRDPYAVDAFIKKYASRDLEFEPGSKYSYNNSGYFLLGAIIEKITGKTYEQALKESILDPLGMKNTGYDHHDTIIPKRAAGYRKAPKGYENAPYLDMSIPYAAGSMYSTVGDLFLWDQALYTDKLLSSTYKELMFKPNLENYAYGWIVTKTSLGQTKETVPAVMHGGGINGFNTLLVRLIDRKHTIVLLDNTSQGRSQNSISKAITNILYDQPYDAPKQSIAEALLPTATDKNVEAAIKQYRDLKANQLNLYDFGEMELNTLGYQLLGMKRIKEAIEVFKLNVEAYPQAANPYDSLGEAYMMNGDKELAVKNYKRALELNPQNKNAAGMLKQIENPAAKVSSKLYDAYVGQYELTPSFVLTITKEGEKLFGQATGQPSFELFPESQTKFFVRVVDAKITFVKDDKGTVTSLILHQNGRDMPAKKIK
jgi:CubicO group peptidase (beta-lactamase class C family)